MSSTKWTKREIKAMLSALNTFLVYSRSVDVDWLGRVLKEKRAEIVVLGLRDDIAIANKNLAQEREMLVHLRQHPEGYGKANDEMLERFSKLAQTSEKSIAWTNKLIARVTAESLPDEVTNFDPIRRS